MTVTVFEAVRYLGKISNYSKDKMNLRRIIYIMNLFHTGETGKGLVDDTFKAEITGPKITSLHKLFPCSDPDDIILEKYFWIEFEFYENTPDIAGTPEAEFMDNSWEYLKDLTSSELFGITRYEKGAYYKRLILDETQKRKPCDNLIFPNDLIEEYNARNLGRWKFGNPSQNEMPKSF